MSDNIIIIIGVYGGLSFLIVFLLLRTSQIKELGAQIERNWHKLDTLEAKATDSQDSIARLQDQNLLIANTLKLQNENQKFFSEQQDRRLENMEKRLSEINDTTERRLLNLQKSNEEKLDKMRETVDEKLQKTLEDRLAQSFQQVSKQLEEVYKGLGEMQNLATGVGDLKKVLSNVKTRGILGEIQLGAILEQILPRERFAENVVTKRGSAERVEYALMLPGEDEKHPVYLPIDAKFPLDRYSVLRDAQENGDKEQITEAWKALEQNIKKNAKDIHEKYIDPPYTTDFGIMFLPIEGLYAEVVQRGMVEVLQRDYKVNVAGPSTMAALLNSLQMGFKTLAIQKHTNEVWNVLSSVQKEFDTFGVVLQKTQERLHQADDELEKLVGVRTRKIQSTLKKVQKLEGPQADSLPNPLDGLDEQIELTEE